MPGVRASLAAGWRAAAQGLWLAPVGMLVALCRSGLALPARLFAGAALVRGALAALARVGLRPESMAEGALAAILRPRFAAILLGLWLAGLFLSAALRVAYLAGALPTLGHALAGERHPPPAFAAGVAYGMPRLVGTGLLAWLLDLAGAAFAAAVLFGAVLVGVHPPGPRTAPLAALVVAAALTLSLLVPFALSTLGDAALARSALRAEPPLRALARAAGRFLSRPAVFLLAALAAASAGWVLVGSAKATANIAMGASRASGWLLLGPQMLSLALSALLASLVDLWRLGAVATLACHEEPDELAQA